MSTAVPSRSTALDLSGHPDLTAEPTPRKALRYVAAVTRISIGWVFL